MRSGDTLLNDITPMTENTMKMPGLAKVSIDANSLADCGETYVTRGENGVGKLISTNASLGAHLHGSHLGKTIPDGKERKHYITNDLEVDGTATTY